MKKMYFLWVAMLSLVAILLDPAGASAIPAIYYDLGDGNELYIGALVCKIDDCLTNGEETDWKNYSDISASPEATGGNGNTLTASPGDTLTFMGATQATGEVNIFPVYGISFTGDSYLEDFDIFGTGMEDVDLDSNDFVYAAPDDIILSSGLTSEMIIQIGLITAKIKSDVPDQTVITGTFYVANPNDQEFVGIFGDNKAYAAGEDTYLASTVRIIVDNPSAPAAPEAAAVTALPQTGPSNTPTNNTFLVILYLGLLSISIPVGNYVVKKYLKK